MNVITKAGWLEVVLSMDKPKLHNFFKPLEHTEESNMAPWTVKEQPAQPQAKSDDQDISSLLSAEQRADLTLLIAGISEKMRKSLILNTFDPSLNIGKSPQQALNLTDAKNPNIDADHEETEEEEKGRKLREKRNKELSEPKQQELKLAALEYLSKWQDSVITRVGEAVNVKREADLNKQEVRNTSSPAVPPVEDKKISRHSTSVVIQVC